MYARTHVNCVKYVYVLIIVCPCEQFTCVGFINVEYGQAVKQLDISSILAVTVFVEGVVSGILDTGD